ncbi:MAG: amylo-alpha-1,6-glucosidase, partial [Terriglobales bacterium]
MECGHPPSPNLIRLEARPHQLIASHSRTVMVCDRDGQITGGDQGLFLHETRMLSRYLWRVNRELYTVEASNVLQNSLLVYAIARPRRLKKGYSGSLHGSGSARDATEETIELRLATVLTDGFHQDVDVRNFTIQPQTVVVALDLDADFAGLDEVLGRHREQRGRLRRHCEAGESEATLGWSYEAEHRGRSLARSVALEFRGLPQATRWSRRGMRCQLELAPGAGAHFCIELSAQVEQQQLRPSSACYALAQLPPRQAEYIAACPRVWSLPPPLHQHPATLQRAFERSRHDLAALRLSDLDRGDAGGPAWVPAAGIPNYVATFGRDILTAAWQSAILGPGIMRGALRVLREMQGSRDLAWRDEEPGKMLHEAHTGPLSVLDYRPQGRYYGSFNTSPFYIIVLSEFYHWTGDRAATLQHLPAAQAALAWMDRYGHPAHKHFFAYRTRSSQGVKNQGWKDSGDALIYPDGSIVPDPIATCEIQGYAYEAKLRMTELLWLNGERGAAAKTLWQAHELKKRFNDAFWMEAENYFAMALDRRGRQVRSVGSDPGDALATGIIAPEHARATVARLFAGDMFSGWGIRTLSSDHLAYNPYSYHRGSVWPAENAAIGVGLRRYDFSDRLGELYHAQLAVAE